MSDLSKSALFWTPRALSIAFLAFLSLFAIDVFAEHLGFLQTALALAMHLIPVFGMLVILLLAWRWEWIGAVFYTAAGLLYVWWVLSRAHPLPLAIRMNWILVIAGPAFVIAGLFLANWLKRADLHVHGR
jgi:hypothetical protein